MPLYSYRCECGWEKEKLFRASMRPSEIDCEECGRWAMYHFSPSKHQSNDAKYTTSYSSEKKGLSLHQYKCRDCESVFERVVDHAKAESVEDTTPCTECGSENTDWKPSVRIDRFSEQFPYFDRGLGVWLKNKEHRRQICKERGLTPVGNDLNEDKIFSQFDKRRETEEKEYNDYCDRLDNAPEFAEFRKAVDKGQITV